MIMENSKKDEQNQNNTVTEPEEAEPAVSFKSLLSCSKGYYLLVGFFSVVLLISVIFGFHGMKVGYMNVYGTSREVSWGLLISTYIFFVVTSTGLCIISSIGHVFGVKELMPIAKRAVFLSIVTILSGFAVIFFEIENPFRMAIYNVISPNLTSNIWWMGTLYGAYLVFMAAEFLFINKNNHKLASLAGLLGLISGIAAHSNLGAIFAMLHGREYWYGPYLPIYFIASAMMSGCATILFFSWLAYRINKETIGAPMHNALQTVGKLCALMIAVIAFFTTWKLLTGLVGGEGKVETIKALLFGPYAFNFWMLEMLLGLIIPFAIFFISKFRNLNLMFVASLLMVVSIYFMRYDLVIIGQVVPSFHELDVTQYKGLLEYTPTIHEILISMGGISMTALLFLLGEKIFRGHKSEIH
ncbi:MAG: NrfD/PsrC family molybdoenzyme membrane anchor subunit [Thermodesulfovibrionales bacterium]